MAVKKLSTDALANTVATLPPGALIPLITTTPDNKYIAVENTAADALFSGAYQAIDATLTSLSALGTATDRYAYTTGVDTWAEGTITAFARTILDDADAATARATLGLVIGTDVQAYDATLQSLSALGTGADKMVYATGVDTWAEADLTAFARTLLDDASAAAARATLGLVIGTNVQAYDADLVSIAALSPADNNFIVGSASGWVTESGATARTSLGLGSVENTALSTWAGTTNIVTVGVVSTGTWQGTAIANAYVAGLDQDVLTTSSPSWVGGTFSGAVTVGTTIGVTGKATVGDIAFTSFDSSAVVKGDLIVATDVGDMTRFGLGTNGQFLMVDTAVSGGMSWSSIPGGSTTFDGMLDVDLTGTQVTNSTLRWNGTDWVDNGNFRVDATGDVVAGTWGGNALATASSPTFAGLTVSGAASLGATTVTGNLTVSGKVVGTTANGYLDLFGDAQATSGVRIFDTGRVRMDGMPTSDPSVAGVLWNDSGTVKISAG